MKENKSIIAAQGTSYLYHNLKRVKVINMAIMEAMDRLNLPAELQPSLSQ